MSTYKTRAEVPEQERWNLTDLYSNQNNWDHDYQTIEKMAENLKAYDGDINDGTSYISILNKEKSYHLSLTNFMPTRC